MVQTGGELHDTEEKEGSSVHAGDEITSEKSVDKSSVIVVNNEKGDVEYDVTAGSFKNLAEGDADGELGDGQDEGKSAEKPKVPDGGYGWLVVLGCFLSHVIIGGFERNDGVYFLQFKSRFDKSAQLTAWPGALVSTLRLFLGPVASAICNLYSVRFTTLIGALLLTLAQILNAFTPNFYFLFFSHTAVQGLGRGLMYAPSLIIISMYFDKHQGLAAGLGSSGVGVGTFCFVPLTQLLFEVYGFQGTFLIMAGIAFNGVLVAMLYRPLSMHYKFTQKYKMKCQDEADDDAVMARLAEAGDTTSIHSMRIHRQSLSLNEKEEMKELTKTAQANSLGKTKKKKDGWFMSSIRICFPVEQRAKTGAKKKKLFNFGLLRDPSFLMFCVSIGLFTSAFKAAFTFIPALAKSKNLTESEAAMVLSISGVFDTVGRIVSGFILDRSVLRPLRPVFYNSFIFMIATVSFILPSLTSFMSLAVMCSLYGTLTGAYISQKSVVLVDILGIENMSSSFGLLIWFQAIGTCIGPPLSGGLRDAFGGFDEAFYLGGSLMVVAGLLMVASNVFLRIKRRRHKHFQKSAASIVGI